MDNKRKIDERLLEAMDACRPDGEDLADPQLSALAHRLAADPELAEAFYRLQRADARLKAAFADVPVPEGLAQRILDRMAAAQPTAAASRQRISRRRLLVGMAAAATAASVLAGVLLGLKTQRPDTPSSVLEQATQFFAAGASKPGHRLPEMPPPADYPLSRDVLRTPHIRWHMVDDFLGGTAVAYDLTVPGGPRAVLYVTRQTVPGLPAFPPPLPAWTTAGCSAAAWQDDTTLYVLVVEGDSRDYRGYLNLSSGPLT